jgi:hypothetical protein
MEKYSRELLKTYQEDFRLSREAGLVPIPSLVGYSIVEWKDMAKSFEDIGQERLNSTSVVLPRSKRSREAWEDTPFCRIRKKLSMW